MEDDTDATVLVVDDDRRAAESYADRLDGEVATAYDGETALARLGDHVDVVLLDRRMPGMSGEAVLRRIRETGYDCRVAMLTGVEPEMDVLDMGFDEYIRKPTSGEELRETVTQLYRRSEYDARLQRYFALASKAATLETNHDRAELEGRESYVELRTELARLGRELDAALDRLSTRERYAIAAGDEPSRDASADPASTS